MDKNIIRKAIALILGLMGAAVTITDAFGMGTGIQYAFNIFFFVVIVPVCVELYSPGYLFGRNADRNI